MCVLCFVFLDKEGTKKKERERRVKGKAIANTILNGGNRRLYKEKEFAIGKLNYDEITKKFDV